MADATVEVGKAAEAIPGALETVETTPEPGPILPALETTESPADDAAKLPPEEKPVLVPNRVRPAPAPAVAEEG
jgi:hypothetical protein